MSSSEFHEKFKSKDLRDFRLGTVASSDHETPLTVLEAGLKSTGEVCDVRMVPDEKGTVVQLIPIPQTLVSGRVGTNTRRVR